MRPRVWVGFAVFCVAAGSRWLLDQAMPSPLDGLLRLTLHHLLLFALWAAWCLVGQERPPRRWGRIALLAGAAWALPETVISYAGGRVSGPTEALVFSLIPVVVVFIVAQQAMGFGDDSGPRSLVAPAFAGILGAGLLIPFDTPPSTMGKLWLAGLVLAIVLVALAAVALHRDLQGIGVVRAALLTSGAVACWGTVNSWDRAAVLGLDRAGWMTEGLVAVCVDGPLLLLGLWLLREMPPVGAAVRYPVTLLVTVGESFVLLHGSLHWEMMVGAALMAGSAGWLLRGLPENAAAG